VNQDIGPEFKLQYLKKERKKGKKERKIPKLCVPRGNRDELAAGRVGVGCGWGAVRMRS
jgi:hypothetical protein